ncbi:MAG: nucleoside triphosphate pyrophosphohydrolase [Verrucomicrobiota bacterium]|nr:nucleoside triphosphate pyrophosphohydrolase [Verrucomicrobiota bacterium]
MPEASSTPPKLSLPDPRRVGIDQLLEIVATLRGPGGCPWDQEQTHASLRAGLVEEAYEVVAAINSADDVNLREELGDLLLQTILHSQIATEEGRFTFEDVARAISEKLVRRHPHVFDDGHCVDSAAVLKRWDEIKDAEKGGRPEPVLGDLAAGLPSLMRAEKVQKKAAKFGFDWDNAEPVLAKVREELREVEGAVAGGAAAEIEGEIGDLLFAVVNLARKLNVDAELALLRATDKFVARFTAVGVLARQRSLTLHRMTLAELDALWDEVKAARTRAGTTAQGGRDGS